MMKYGRYLASLIGCVINNTPPLKPFENLNWNILYRLAEHHNVVSLIYPAISSMDMPKDVQEKFIYTNKILIARETRQEIEAQSIFSLLNDNGIRFIKLKGITIKNLYPMPYMRTSADVDIYMSKEDRERSRALMKKAGYNLDASIHYHDEYSKDEFYIYELHSSVISPESKFADIFCDPFRNSVTDPDGINYQLNKNYFYLHLMIHLSHHFLTGGCGIRHLCDIYVFEKSHPDLDMDFINNIIKPYELTVFFNTIRNLAYSLFEDKEISKDEMYIAEFIFKSGERGNGELRHISWLSDDKHITWTFTRKCKYFLRLWFPDVDTMKKRYSVLHKFPVLLPVFWVRRIFYTLFFKRSAIKEQRNEIRRLNSNELKEAKRIRNLAGLK